MNKKQEQIARDAKKVNKDWTIDDFIDYMVEVVPRNYEFFWKQFESAIEMISFDFDQLYK